MAFLSNSDSLRSEAKQLHTAAAEQVLEAQLWHAPLLLPAAPLHSAGDLQQHRVPVDSLHEAPEDILHIHHHFDGLRSNVHFLRLDGPIYLLQQPE